MIYDIDRVIKYVIYTYYYTTKLRHEELYQIGYVGYLKALQNVDERGMSLNYVYWYIRQEINMNLKKENQYVNVDNILLDNMNGKLDVLVYDDTISKVKDSLHSLTVPERFIITQKYLSDTDIEYKEIADILGVSKQRVHQLKNRSLNKLKEVLIV